MSFESTNGNSRIILTANLSYHGSKFAHESRVRTGDEQASDSFERAPRLIGPDAD